MTDQPTTNVDRIVWHPGINMSGEDIPPFAVMKACWDFTTGAYHLYKPDHDNATQGLGFNGPVTIRAPLTINGQNVTVQGTGQFTFDLPYSALYSNYDYVSYPTDPTYPDETYGEMPECGDEWGVKAGSWALQEGQTGFYVLGVDPVRRVAMVERVGGGGSMGEETITFVKCVSVVDLDDFS